MSFIIPSNYRPVLDLRTTLCAIQFVNETFRRNLERALDLVPVPAQLFVPPEAGLNDDLGSGYHSVSFTIDSMDDRKAEIVRSLSKWKRSKLLQYRIPPEQGLLAEVKAIRVDDAPDNIHSVFVDQWDWERTIRPVDRTLLFLKNIVRKIYGVMKELERSVCKEYPQITPYFPEEITFIHSEELLREFPDLEPAQREQEIVRKHRAVFLIGIGGALSNGETHGKRDADSDDWSTPCGDGFAGLNGDILVWNPVLETCFELSSMGIRVDGETMFRQLSLCGLEHLSELPFHQAVLSGSLPLSIGGGIGQSRFCMLMLRKAHIGEVQPGMWTDEIVHESERSGIPLL